MSGQISESMVVWSAKARLPPDPEHSLFFFFLSILDWMSLGVQTKKYLFFPSFLRPPPPLFFSFNFPGNARVKQSIT